MNPTEEYSRRLEARKTVVAAFDKQHIRVGNVRLVIGLAGAITAYSAFAERSMPMWWLAAPIAAFIALAVWHERILRGRTLAQRAVLCYERALARIHDTWTGSGEEGNRFIESGHPYAEDLDLFGKGSLFQLLSLARTRSGERTLAQWLLAPASFEDVRARQEAVAELRDAADLRERIFVLGEDVRDTVNTDKLVEWAEAPPLLRAGPLWTAAAGVTLLVAASAIAWATLDQRTMFVGSLALATVYGYFLRPRVRTVLIQVDEALHALDLLASLLKLIEGQPFQTPMLRAIQRQLTAHGKPASHHVAALDRLEEWIDSRDNQLMRLIGPPLLMGTHLAFAAERWRAVAGPSIRQWLAGVSTVEALLSLSAYHYEHPSDPFPEIVTEPTLEGVELGHPLVPLARCVTNSIQLGRDRQLLVVSGSNMSGKSTYLRAIGINVVLAMAGAPVRAQKLRLCPLQVGSTIRVNDSLQGGSSRFFAEITRLHTIVDLAAKPPTVLFLLDEVLAGTNSRDRRIGAEGVIRELLTRNAIGLITTHDLALTSVVDALEPRAANIHFEDHLEGGKLRFDYKVRPGVVQKSNALELMRSIGLDV
ncbi:MAG: mismatch repair protein [Acidobacteria bacterium]|nr:mismatch repair protein [Acidobacteriota bacterium]